MVDVIVLECLVIVVSCGGLPLHRGSIALFSKCERRERER